MFLHPPRHRVATFSFQVKVTFLFDCQCGKITKTMPVSHGNCKCAGLIRPHILIYRQLNIGERVFVYGLEYMARKTQKNPVHGYEYLT